MYENLRDGIIIWKLDIFEIRSWMSKLEVRSEKIMKNLILIFQIAVSLSLIVLIVLQAKGVGLGRAWGGDGGFYKSRRGVEKIVFNLTVGLVFVFLVTSILTLIFS